MSSSNQIRISQTREVTYDTAPGPSPSLQTMRFRSELLSATPNIETTDELRTDRIVGDQSELSRTTGGPVGFLFSAVTYDAWYEGLFNNAWSLGGGATLNDVLTVGTDETQNQFLLYKDYQDVAGAFLLLTGQRVNTLTQTFQFGQYISGEFTFAGGKADVETGLTTPTFLAPTTTSVRNATSDIPVVNIDGAPSTVCINQIVLNASIGLRPNECIGSLTPTDQKPGRTPVSGTIQMYLSANAWTFYKNTLSQTPVDVEWRVDDAAGNSYLFMLPKIKLAGPTPSAAGIDQDVIVDATFNAVGDSVTEYFQIERTLV